MEESSVKVETLGWNSWGQTSGQQKRPKESTGLPTPSPGPDTGHQRL